MVKNKVKFVLRDGFYDFTDWDYHTITQHYLPGDIRIRQDSLDEDTEYSINTKSLRDDGAHYELEYSIDKPVYDMLAKHQSLRSIVKVRYAKHVADEHWTVDFMLDGEQVYFVLGECEMPEHRVVPLHIPPQVAYQLLYAVPRDQTSLYSNYRISDKSYAKQLMKEVAHGS